MVQVFDLSPTESSGSLLGRAIAQGVARRFPSPEQQVQRGLLQESLAKLKALGQQPNANAFDLAAGMMEATAGIPGAEKYVSQLYPLLLNQMMANQIRGGAGQEGLMQGFTPQPTAGGQAQPAQVRSAPMAQQQPQGPMRSGENVSNVMMNQPAYQPQQPPQGVQGLFTPPGTGGVAGGPAPMTQSGAGINPQALNMSVQTGDLSNYDLFNRMLSGQAQEETQTAIQQQQLARSQQLADYAQRKLTKGDVAPTPEELNQFLRIGQKYRGMNPEDWFANTKRDFDKYIDVRANFDNANIPGYLSGMMRGGKYREDALKRLEGLAKPLVELGDEATVRSSLAKNGLSPTEIEMIVRPLSPESMARLKKVPHAPYQEPSFYDELVMGETPTLKRYDQVAEKHPKIIQKTTDQLSDYLLKNVSQNDSLLGIRETLRQQKGYDWRQYLDALNKAQEKGLKLSADQQRELGELTSSPRDSLLNIFENWGRWMDVLKGAK